MTGFVGASGAPDGSRRLRETTHGVLVFEVRESITKSSPNVFSFAFRGREHSTITTPLMEERSSLEDCCPGGRYISYRVVVEGDARRKPMFTYG